MAINFKAIQEQYARLNGEKKAANQQKKGPPYQQWKPSLTEDGKPKTWAVRILPYKDQNEQPFQVVSYYDSKKFTTFRMVAPFQFDMEDPIQEFVEKLKADKKITKVDPWPVIKELFPKQRFFAPVFVRDEPEKLAQVWEFSPTLAKDLYAILCNPDFLESEEDVTSPDTGYDLQVTVSPSGKVFKVEATGKEYPVNDVKVIARAKPSPLSKDPAMKEKILKSIPNLQEIFKGQAKSPEELDEALQNYLKNGVAAQNASEAGENHTGETDAATEASAMKNVEDQFAGL